MAILWAGSTVRLRRARSVVPHVPNKVASDSSANAPSVTTTTSFGI
ncbi:hypothetical protein [Candidatus Ichthyocystis sparus]|nr:hypothetical protein [Candidatus Ichthyocystis sparus]